MAEIKKQTDAKVIIHKHEAETLKNGESSEIVPVKLMSRIVRMLIKNNKVQAVKGDILIDKPTSLKEYGIKGKVIHTPGHTEGSLSVILDNGEALVGDLAAGGKKGNKVFEYRVKSIIKRN